MLLDQMIITGRFDEFVIEFIDIQYEEIKQKTQWEFYLHRMYDSNFISEFPTFSDFVNQNEVESVPVSTDDLETTVKNSFDMMRNFVPD